MIRGFLIVMAAVLGAIAAGVGIMAATQPASPVVECASLRSCIQTARAFSIDTPILTPGDLDLRFVTGWLYPNEGLSFT